ncbi:type II toxin-antitoxin system VapC family toxin [Microbacterium profundi]|uniref:PIN domain-containing protein n=1 Tax=Microbacterium profundi TaxID=450380 RepID=UPI00051A63E6|nr:PIN domain-containing protein [Microbacterium profundi]MCE7481619.1 type II toxin-antitoxin system VapC family toxin [Microbacterium profundi]
MQLLDTSVLITFGESALPDDATVLSAISEAELRFGIEHAPSPQERRSRTTRFARIEYSVAAGWAPFDSAAAASYGHLAALVAKTRPSHARSKDIMLAAHAHSLGAVFVTLNPKDFELVADEVEVIVPELRTP